MRKLFGGLIMTLLLVTAGTVYAGERGGAFVVSPFVGGYTFDGAERLETRPMVGLRLGYDFTKNWGAEATFNYVSTRFTRLIPGTVNVYNYRLEGIYNFMPEEKLVPYLAVGGGGETINTPLNVSFQKIHNTQPTANIGAGVKWFLGEDVAIRADYHTNFIVNSNDIDNKKQDYLVNYEYSIGLQMLFGGKKPLPPASSLSVLPGSIMKGQSATLSWTSQNVTNCTIQPGVGPVEPQGSLSVSPSADTTYTLNCSGAAGTTSSVVNVAVSQPPVPTSTLSAAPDSVPQGASATLTWNAENATNCDLQPGIGPVKPQGSVSVTPSATTTYTLTCNGPGGTTSSTANVALAGCPVVLTPEQEEVVDLHIQFDFNKTEVKPQYAPNIDALGDFMKKYPCDVTLEGHTDNVGGMAYNQDLSQRRADAVKNYLVEKFGIDSNRIKTVGYGETKPIASNDTEAGRYQNRRVQARHAAIKK